MTDIAWLALAAVLFLIDLSRRAVTVSGLEVKLTPREYRLLSELARHAGRVLTHEALLRSVWGPACTHQHHDLRVYMAQLRHKLEADPSRPRLLLTETGVGYRLAEPADERGPGGTGAPPGA